MEQPLNTSTVAPAPTTAPCPWRSARFLGAIRFFSPEALTSAAMDGGRSVIQALKAFPRLEHLFEQNARVWEGYSIEEHTGMVITQAEKYGFLENLPARFNAHEFRLILALHDIGKSIPEDKRDQHGATLKILDELVVNLAISKENYPIYRSLVGDDRVGKLFKAVTLKRPTKDDFAVWANRATERGLTVEDLLEFQSLSVFRSKDEEGVKAATTELVEYLKAESTRLNVDPLDYYNLLLAYYQSDTTAYTHDAMNFEGRRAFPSLEHLYLLNAEFDPRDAQSQLFQVDDETGLLKFAPPLDVILDEVKTRISER